MYQKKITSAIRTNDALINIVPNVHDDDIHGICLIDEEHIISGSKDNTVRLFNLKNNSSEIVSSSGTTYNSWVTALDVLSDNSIIAGHRNGYLLRKNVFNNVFYTRTNIKKHLENNAPKEKQSKERNFFRIQGIKSFRTEGGSGYSALIGLDREFYHYDFFNNRVSGGYKFDNDREEWIYGFCQIDIKHVVAIHACSLSLFEFNVESNGASHWTLRDTIMSEYKSTQRYQRPFISSVFSMEKEIPCGRLALSLFGGVTKVIDLESNKDLHATNEHRGRVWQTIPFSCNEYLSCSDDATIKGWDLRSKGSIFTYSNHPGRVSSLAVIRDSIFVAGTCPDNPHVDKHKGQFYFYDIRKSKSSLTDSNIGFSEAVTDSNVTSNHTNTTELSNEFSKLALNNKLSTLPQSESQKLWGGFTRQRRKEGHVLTVATLTPSFNQVVKNPQNVAELDKIPRGRVGELTAAINDNRKPRLPNG